MAGFLGLSVGVAASGGAYYAGISPQVSFGLGMAATTFFSGYSALTTCVVGAISYLFAQKVSEREPQEVVSIKPRVIEGNSRVSNQETINSLYLSQVNHSQVEGVTLSDQQNLMRRVVLLRKKADQSHRIVKDEKEPQMRRDSAKETFRETVKEILTLTSHDYLSSVGSSITQEERDELSRIFVNYSKYKDKYSESKVEIRRESPSFLRESRNGAQSPVFSNATDVETMNNNNSKMKITTVKELYAAIGNFQNQRKEIKAFLEKYPFDNSLQKQLKRIEIFIFDLTSPDYLSQFRDISSKNRVKLDAVHADYKKKIGVRETTPLL